jgi:hypothetical protein
VAILAAGGISAGGTGAAGSAVGGTSIGSGARAQGSSSGTRGKARDRSTARAVERLVRAGFKVREQGVEVDSDCAAHSYGQVQDFFRAHPCTELFRALLEVRGGGATALIAVAWVDMPDAGQASALKALVDRPATGNVTELSRERGGQRFTGEYYRSHLEGTTVVNVQAEPQGRTRAAVGLARRAADSA